MQLQPIRSFPFYQCESTTKRPIAVAKVPRIRKIAPHEPRRHKLRPNSHVRNPFRLCQGSFALWFNKCAAEPRFVYLWADILPGLDFRLWGVTQYFSEQLLRDTF